MEDLQRTDGLKRDFPNLFQRHEPRDLYVKGIDFTIRTLLEDGASSYEITCILSQLFDFPDKSLARALIKGVLDTIAMEAEEADTVKVTRKGMMEKLLDRMRSF